MHSSLWIINLPVEPISALEGDHEVDGVVVGDGDGLDVGAPADLLVLIIPIVRAVC